MNPNITLLLQEIEAITGWSQPRIAEELGVSQPTIHRILNGQSDCKGTTMMAIVRLHKSLCAKPRQAAIAEAEKKRNGGIRQHGDSRDAKNISK